MTHLELMVDGMTCGGCSSRLDRLLSSLPGVSSATADHQAQRVQLDYDPQQLDVAEIHECITDAGFMVRAT